MATLSVSTANDKILFVLQWNKNSSQTNIGNGSDAYPRSTKSSEPEFLTRLKDYLQRQFHSFKYELSLDEENK